MSRLSIENLIYELFYKYYIFKMIVDIDKDDKEKLEWYIKEFNIRNSSGALLSINQAMYSMLKDFIDGTVNNLILERKRK